MDAWLAYILRVNACLIGFYTFYQLFLRWSTFLKSNRIYLLAGLAMSFVIPILKISWPAVAPLPAWDFEPVFLSAAEDALPEGGGPTGTVRATFPVLNVLAGVYEAGVFVLLLRLLRSLWQVFRLKRRASTARFGGWIVRQTDGTKAFSLFRTIFLPRGGVPELVLEHEKVHVLQGHTFDLLFMETAVALLWFNPVAFLYRRTLNLLHEYLADEGTLRSRGDVRAYLECLLDQIQTGCPGRLTHAFGSNHSLKKRIAMMTKKKTPRHRAWIYTLALPLVGALTFGFSIATGVSAAEQTPGHPVAPPQTVDSADHTPSILPFKGEDGERFNVSTDPAAWGSERGGLRHSGIDFVLYGGMEVLATASGQVTESNYSDARGNYIVIRHDDKYETWYAHLESATAKAGDTVSKGQTIGTVGSTGRSTGPHLHYEVRKNGTPVDPTAYFPGFSSPR